MKETEGETSCCQKILLSRLTWRRKARGECDERGGAGSSKRFIKSLSRKYVSARPFPSYLRVEVRLDFTRFSDAFPWRTFLALPSPIEQSNSLSQCRYVSVRSFCSKINSKLTWKEKWNFDVLILHKKNDLGDFSRGDSFAFPRQFRSMKWCWSSDVLQR